MIHKSSEKALVAFPLSCVIMAAGISRRFQNPIKPGSATETASLNKLSVDFKGKPLLRWTLDCFAQLRCCSRIVVARTSDTENLVPKDIFQIVWNNGENLSPSVTIRNGLLSVSDCAKGCLFAVGDQPLLTYASVYRLCTMFCENPENIISLSWNQKRGNPVIFPRALFSELFALKDWETGRTIIDRHPELLLTVEADRPDELMDIDTHKEYIDACNRKFIPNDPIQK